MGDCDGCDGLNIVVCSLLSDWLPPEETGWDLNVGKKGNHCEREMIRR